jgi:ElaB/YqjD/DUF883 family membrane-anchored ribosome-binding protein
MAFGTCIARRKTGEDAMNNFLDESRVARAVEVRTGCAGTCCGRDAQEVVKRIEKGVNDAKAAVAEKLEDGKIAAKRLLKRGRYGVEDCIEKTSHDIKRHPFGFVGIAFAAGAALGFLVPRATKKCSSQQ